MTFQQRKLSSSISHVGKINQSAEARSEPPAAELWICRRLRGRQGVDPFLPSDLKTSSETVRGTARGADDALQETAVSALPMTRQRVVSEQRGPGGLGPRNLLAKSHVCSEAHFSAAVQMEALTLCQSDKRVQLLPRNRLH